MELAPFARSHLPAALALSQEMGWPYRLEDWAVALDLGQGFVLEAQGRVIGTAAWWPYGDAHASCGMIIVTRAAQGRGCGARLMDALLDAAASRAVTLNSTPEGAMLYARRGFTATGTIAQHQGIPKRRFDAPCHADVVRMSAVDLGSVGRLDREASGWDRGPMLRRLVGEGQGHLLMRDGVARGFAICRLFGRGHVVGPVVADTREDAQALIGTALAPLGRSFARVDTATGTGLGPWLDAIGLPQVGDATTMVRGPQARPSGPARMFALANQSFN